MDRCPELSCKQESELLCQSSHLAFDKKKTVHVKILLKSWILVGLYTQLSYSVGTWLTVLSCLGAVVIGLPCFDTVWLGCRVTSKMSPTHWIPAPQLQWPEQQGSSCSLGAPMQRNSKIISTTPSQVWEFACCNLSAVCQGKQLFLWALRCHGFKSHTLHANPCWHKVDNGICYRNTLGCWSPHPEGLCMQRHYQCEIK